MSFGKIWKKQVQVPKGNVSLFKPKQGFELDNDEDKCCEEALERWERWAPKDFKSNKDCLDFKTYLQELVEIDGWGRKHRIAGYVLEDWEECEKNVQ